MDGDRRSSVPHLCAALAPALILGLLSNACPSRSLAAEFRTLHEFGGSDGEHPNSLVVDPQGVLYGTAGGRDEECSYGCGVVFKLSPPVSGKSTWTNELLHRFSGRDGDGPRSLVIGQDGILYGVAFAGGNFSDKCVYGCGTVFRLEPPAPEQEELGKLRVLYRFSGNDGTSPRLGVVTDEGVLYGTTIGGGLENCFDDGCGTVFQLRRRTLKTLRSFSGTDGARPTAGVAMDPEGILYGTTHSGGVSTACVGGCGTVFRLSPRRPDKPPRKYKRLHSFSRHDGKWPNALMIDQDGALYGATWDGKGTVFKLSPPAPGERRWTHEVLHRFSGSDGVDPTSLVFGGGGVLYGTTGLGGPGRLGTVFKLEPPKPNEASWQHTVLHGFARGLGGTQPNALVIAPDGALYGTTYGGGSSNCNLGCGTIFRIVP